MSNKTLLSQLNLAYAPLTAYEFATVKDDPEIEKAMGNASLYIIAQRPVITFENVYPDLKSYELKFEIHQEANENIIYGALPLIQPIVGSKEEDTIMVSFNKLDKSNQQDDPPFYGVHGFSLLKDDGRTGEFLIWFSPEKLLQNLWRGYIKCELEGDLTSLTTYQVHYVGKATKQSILKRLTGHSTFQDILSLESPVTEKQLPANEIIILPFEFQENLQFQSFGEESEISEMVAAVKGETYPKQETVFLDAEKAIIKAIQSEYNKELFKNYPKSKDGLYKDKYNLITYSFCDPITLVYADGEIKGELSVMGGDAIIIENGKEMKLVKKNT